MQTDRETRLLEIVIDLDQYALVPELKCLFPDLSRELLFAGRSYWRASLAEGPQGAHQRAFLEEHKLAYLDRKLHCEQSIRLFFGGVTIAGRPIEHLTFGAVPGVRGAYHAMLYTRDSKLCLYFPPEWNPRDWYEDRRVVGWLYVYQAAEEVYASVIGVERCLLEPTRRAATPEEMATWLHEQGYLQVICTTPAPSVYGLYKPGDQ